MSWRPLHLVAFNDGLIKNSSVLVKERSKLNWLIQRGLLSFAGWELRSVGFINKLFHRLLYRQISFAACSERVDLFIRGILSVAFNLDCLHLEACSNLYLVNISPGLLQIFQKHGLKRSLIEKDNIFLGSNIIKVEEIICLFLRILVDLWLLIRLGTRDVKAALGSWWLLVLLRRIHGERNLLDPLSWGIHVKCNLFHFSWRTLS